MKFPDGFQWGVATASYQIEGAVDEGGRAPSIWDTFSHTPGATLNGDTGDVADDHYHRWPEDLGLLRELGVDLYRFSLAWPRLQPERARGAQRGGRRLLLTARRRPARPWGRAVDHALPLGPAAGAAGRGRLAGARHRRPLRRVRRARPRAAARPRAHLDDAERAVLLRAQRPCPGRHAPGLQDDEAAMRAVHHLLLGHGLAVRAMREADPEDELRHHPEPPPGPGVRGHRGRRRRPADRRDRQSALPRPRAARPLPRRRAGRSPVGPRR